MGKKRYGDSSSESDDEAEKVRRSRRYYEDPDLPPVRDVASPSSPTENFRFLFSRPDSPLPERPLVDYSTWVYV
ncbi:unnamed protein product [Soboliphyme baturini]|uniref:Uncharacterized protein n=1 Tax=Soboliphyme baturini TaxID=241478 RepID=A0A183I953_9BILA|nr:unnamed protein product [Soboliphyme baturini]